jgi:uncharacterized protein
MSARPPAKLALAVLKCQCYLVKALLSGRFRAPEGGPRCSGARGAPGSTLSAEPPGARRRAAPVPGHTGGAERRTVPLTIRTILKEHTMTQYNPPGAAPTPLSQSDERLWATLVHVGGILIGFISPLIGYLVLKDRSAFAREHTATALNFQITLAIAHVANFILGLILGIITFGIWTIVQILITIALYVVNIVFSIIAAMAANKGQPYTYPLAISFVK